jgi:hypothetical protein
VRELRTPAAAANDLRMRRSTYPGTFLLVEGSSDKIFYERFVDKSGCELVVADGKERVIAVLKILEKDANFQGVLGIIDADFDRLKDSLEHTSHLFRTDTHDLETMIIKSSAFDKVVDEFGSEEKISRFNRDIRQAILESGMVVGNLLWISLCDELNLTFEGISFTKFIDEQTLQVNELSLIRHVKNKSQAHALRDEDLKQRLEHEQHKQHDPWQVCRGHDLVEILSIGLRKAIGSNKATEVDSLNLERSLRLAYESIYFQTTQLYAEICSWESQNQPFKVFQHNL